MAKKARKAKKVEQPREVTVDDIQADVKFLVPIYGGYVMLFRTQEGFKAAQMAMGGSAETISSATVGLCLPMHHPDGRIVYLMGVFDDDEPSVLIHELAHLTLCIAEHVGFDPINEQEPFAYLEQELYELLTGEYD